jgi:hypothetical protein
MKRSFRIFVFIATALALLLPSAGLSIRSANSASFVDASGDSGAAADITSVVVSNDDQGVVTFAIGITNRPQLDATDRVQVIADTDGSSATGLSGFDTIIQIDGPSALLATYDGSKFNRADAPSLRSSYAQNVLTISADLFDLQVIGDFDFFVLAGVGDQGVGKADLAPDHSPLYGFTVKVPLLFDQLEAPSTVKAGKTLDASMTLVTDSEVQGTVACTAKVGKVRIPGTPGWMNIIILPPKDPNGGIVLTTSIGYEADAMCSFKVPKTAKGKVITATIKATRSGVVVSRTFAVRVR